MKQYLFALTILLSLVLQKSKGQNVSIENAFQHAKSFYLSKQTNQIIDFQIQDYREYIKNDTTLFYIINNKNKKGFVIISANELLDPILAYSFNGYINLDSSMPEYEFFLEHLKSNTLNRLRMATINSISKKDEWNKLKWANSSNSKKTRSGVLPLLQTNWNQGCYYNEMCPQEISGPCGKTWAGCVATATGQIMKYWKYPDFGFDSLSQVIQGYNVSANFQNTNYKWDSMPNTLTANNTSIATLLYHVGVANSLNYSSISTWGGLHPIALSKYFKYSNDILKMDWWDYPNWNRTLIDSVTKQLDMGRPVFFSIDFPNHAVVCDGYQDTTFFHLNFGWDGSGDGYYKFVDVGVKNAIINIHPNTPTSQTEDFLLSNDVLIYPNPTSGEINLKFNSIKNELTNLELINALGQKMIEKKMKNNMCKIEMSLGNYPKGIYYLKLHINDSIKSYKIIYQ